MKAVARAGRRSHYADMENSVRWAIFAGVAAIAWTVTGLVYLVLSRHYGSLQISAVMFSAVVLMSFVTALATIAYASRLDEKAESDAAALASRPDGER